MCVLYTKSRVRSIFAQQDAKQVMAQHGRVVEILGKCYPEVAVIVDEAMEEILAFAMFLHALWR